MQVDLHFCITHLKKANYNIETKWQKTNFQTIQNMLMLFSHFKMIFESFKNEKIIV